MFRNWLKSSAFWFAIAGIVVLWVGYVFTLWEWNWLHGDDPSTTASTTLRNMGLLIGGGLAVVFAAWRSWVAERQSKIAQQSLLNERLQKGTEMLGSDVLSVRLGGIYALQNLSLEHPEKYHVEVMRLICAFVRHPTPSDGSGEVSIFPFAEPKREDISAAVEVIRKRDELRIAIERERGFTLDLHGADLSSQHLGGANLSSASLMQAKLSLTNFISADLSYALLADADFTNPVTEGIVIKGRIPTEDEAANIREIHYIEYVASIRFLEDANLSDAAFSLDGYLPAVGLQQTHLDIAKARRRNPPKLDGVQDVKTGEQLVWRGKTPKSSG